MLFKACFGRNLAFNNTFTENVEVSPKTGSTVYNLGDISVICIFQDKHLLQVARKDSVVYEC